MEFYNFVEVSTLKNLRKYNISEGFGDRVFIGGEQSVALALVGVYGSDVKFSSISFELNSPIPLHYIDFWGVSLYGVGCSGLRCRFGAALLSALAKATRHISNVRFATKILQ